MSDKPSKDVSLLDYLREVNPHSSPSMAALYMRGGADAIERLISERDRANDLLRRSWFRASSREPDLHNEVLKHFGYADTREAMHESETSRGT